MQTLTFSTTINAPVAHVWNCMLDKPTYEEWTKVFDASSSYEGSWEQGASIKFWSSTGEGMIAEIAESRPNEFVSIRHLWMIMLNKDTGELETTMNPEEAYENYSFSEENGQTTVTATMTGLPEEYVPMMNDMRPKALAALKEICER